MQLYGFKLYIIVNFAIFSTNMHSTWNQKIIQISYYNLYNLVWQSEKHFKPWNKYYSILRKNGQNPSSSNLPIKDEALEVISSL